MTKIIFEGITGSGKSTQMQLLKKNLEKEHSVCLVNEDSLAVRETKYLRDLLKKLNRPLMSESLLFQLTNWLKLESIAGKYDLLLIDRFVLSNLVYTLARCRLDNLTPDREKMRDSILKPLGSDCLDGTVTIYIDCDVTSAMERTMQRNRRNYFDARLQSEAKRFYMEELQRFDYEWHSVNGNSNIENVQSNIMDCLRGAIK